MAGHILSGNTNNMDGLKSFVASKATVIEDDITEFYNVLSLINSTGAWSGSASESFFTKCDNSKKDLDELVKFLRDYSDLLNTVNTNLGTLCSKVSSNCKGV